MEFWLKVYIPLSVVMFLEYAVSGARAPVLAARLLGPLKMTGKQTGWIYATLPLACIFAPLGAGQVADKYLNAEWILAAAHLIGRCSFSLQYAWRSSAAYWWSCFFTPSAMPPPCRW